MTNDDVRMANLLDYHPVVSLRGQWMDRYFKAHPAGERWCWAACRKPRIEDERELLLTVAGKDDRWTAVVGSQGEPDGYILCRTDKAKGELWIEGQTPRVSPRAKLKEAAGKLLEFVVREASERGLERVRAGFHGFPDEVEPLMSLYGECGFEGLIRFEMVSHELNIDPGPAQLQFRSAEEIGLDAFYEADAMVRNESVEDARKDCELSRKFWIVEPATDWLAAYDGTDLVGTARMAVARTGMGVMDSICIVKERRRRGLGRCLLARGLSALVGRTEFVWTDTDDDHPGEKELLEHAGFQVRHRHGEMAAELKG